MSAVTSTELGYLDGVTSNVQSQLSQKSPIIYDKKIFASAIASNTLSSFGLSGYYADIIPDYSSLSGKTIISSSLIMLGNDATGGSEELTSTTLLASMTYNSNTISKVRAFSTVYQTVRLVIKVIYKD